MWELGKKKVAMVVADLQLNIKRDAYVSEASIRRLRMRMTICALAHEAKDA